MCPIRSAKVPLLFVKRSLASVHSTAFTHGDEAYVQYNLPRDAHHCSCATFLWASHRQAATCHPARRHTRNLCTRNLCSSNTSLAVKWARSGHTGGQSSVCWMGKRRLCLRCAEPGRLTLQRPINYAELLNPAPIGQCTPCACFTTHCHSACQACVLPRRHHGGGHA